MAAELLVKCREVNECWLKAWGCEVRHLGFCVLVQHPHFRDYNAIFDLASPGDVDRAIRVGSSQFASREPGFTIYVPDSRVFVGSDGLLMRTGFKPAFRSETLARPCDAPPEPRGPAVTLVPVSQSTLTDWIVLYQKNAQIDDSLLGADKARWMRAYMSEPSVHFLLIELNGTLAGTVQLVAPGNGYCGVYSLSVSPERRGVHAISQIYIQLVIEAVRHKNRWLFFERLRPSSRGIRDLNSLPHAVKKTPWVVVASETGYRRAADVA